VRPAVVDVAAQWAQLHGWLSANTGRHSDASRSYELAIALATETSDMNMISTPLNDEAHRLTLAAVEHPDRERARRGGKGGC
jgi:hypothetical protein